MFDKIVVCIFIWLFWCIFLFLNKTRNLLLLIAKTPISNLFLTTIFSLKRPIQFLILPPTPIGILRSMPRRLDRIRLVLTALMRRERQRMALVSGLTVGLMLLSGLLEELLEGDGFGGLLFFGGGF